MTLSGKQIVLGVTGSIAAYKAVLLLRELTARGAEVTVVMSANAEHFVGALTFRTLSGRPVLSSLFDPQSEEAVEHVALAERADAFVVAPATANLLAKAAHGIADDFLTTLLLATRCPVLMAPAMDGGMWDHAAVQANVETLRERGVTVLEPEAGALASGLSGRGRLPEVPTLVEAVERALTPQRDLAGERVLVTSGPTREPIDPVRYLSNRSSGKMGHAVASAALRRGAEVVLISGPTTLQPPPGAVYVPVQTAEEMREASLQHLASASVVIKAAAVADYRVERPSATKIKSGGSVSWPTRTSSRSSPSERAAPFSSASPPRRMTCASTPPTSSAPRGSISSSSTTSASRASASTPRTTRSSCSTVGAAPSSCRA